ncbi:hypothetical protein [Streptomyces sp. S.PNR 29]|uniref:hypothetical protein n=1 Tax=Streptomyces sp. S.PNR 29 TaxID=2973805 RepID=UPI0025B0A027|nr:hypothetical protein [Streptomyces sp. S.PNR 29]MDN0201223.1 hypothetical protein [Streptomyces sp. S.PNR 29]
MDVADLPDFDWRQGEYLLDRLRDSAPFNLFGSIAAVMLMVGPFFLLAVLGPLWLFFLSGRRLAMSDDYAAISSAALLALLLLLFVELHLLMQEEAGKVQSLRQVRRESRQQGEKREGELWDQLESFDEHLVSQVRFTLLGVFTATLLAGVLILVCLWAAVDAHGPARWLAWTSWLCICWSFTLVLLLGIRKVVREYLHALRERTEIDMEDLEARGYRPVRLQHLQQSNDGPAFSPENVPAQSPEP